MDMLWYNRPARDVCDITVSVHLLCHVTSQFPQESPCFTIPNLHYLLKPTTSTPSSSNTGCGKFTEQQKALLGTVGGGGGGTVYTSAKVAHQNSLCSVCQGPVVSFSATSLWVRVQLICWRLLRRGMYTCFHGKTSLRPNKK